MAKKRKNRKKILKPIDGWLLAYIIILAGSILVQFITMGITRTGLAATFYLVSLILSIAALILILLRKRTAINWTLAGLWVAFLQSLTTSIIRFNNIKEGTISSVTQNSIARDLAMEITWLILAIIWAVIWTYYFLKSKRVRETLVK